MLMPKPSESPRSFVSMTKLRGLSDGKIRIRKDKMPMGNVSYSAHISNGKSAITSKKALAGVAKHNLRKYKSADYNSDNIRLIYGTTDLFQDVKRVYHREFDDVVKEYKR